jgi:hypothetical protein
MLKLVLDLLFQRKIKCNFHLIGPDCFKNWFWRDLNHDFSTSSVEFFYFQILKFFKNVRQLKIHKLPNKLLIFSTTLNN